MVIIYCVVYLIMIYFTKIIFYNDISFIITKISLYSITFALDVGTSTNLSGARQTISAVGVTSVEEWQQLVEVTGVTSYILVNSNFTRSLLSSVSLLLV